MQTKSALQLVTEDLFGQMLEDGVIYAEFRFAPFLHTEHGLTPEQVVEAVDLATERMISQTGIAVRLILCTLRHFSREQSLATARLVDIFRGSRVVALDLAGDEAGFPLDAHIEAYRYAKERGLFRTAHAGEACGPQSVWETLRQLEPTRIGHGTRSIEDPELVDHLRDTHIHLELCPSANVQIIPSIKDWPNHPIDCLYRAGISLNVNTDTRMLTRTTLTREYQQMQAVFHWGTEQFRKSNMMAIDAAFVEDSVKDELRAVVADAYSTV